MKSLIRQYLRDPEKLEALYQNNKKSFTQSFWEVTAALPQTPLIQFWQVRLKSESPKQNEKQLNIRLVSALIATVVLAGVLIKLPELFKLPIDAETFYLRNTSIIVFFAMALFHLLSQSTISLKNTLTTLLLFLIPTVYVNLLPVTDADSLQLVYLHLPPLMWCIYGYVYIGFKARELNARMQYLKFNGDLATLGAILLLAGMMLAGITISLFEVIDIRAEEFYMEYIVIWGLTAAPVVTHFIIMLFPNLSNKIAPIVAQLFSPLVLITLTVYLAFIPFSGKDPYADRDFLLVFNLMLIGVMGLIVYSVSERWLPNTKGFMHTTLLLLTGITLVVNSIALSAIFYRLGAFGISPNRIAVLGTNVLIFTHLIFIFINLFKVALNKIANEKVQATIAWYLPVYAAWAAIVVVGFPLLFGIS